MPTELARFGSFGRQRNSHRRIPTEGASAREPLGTNCVLNRNEMENVMRRKLVTALLTAALLLATAATGFAAGGGGGGGGAGGAGGAAGGAGGAAGGATGSPTGGAPSPAGVGPVGSPAAVNPASASPAGVISRPVPGVSISPSGNPPGTEGAAAAMPGLANRPGCAGGVSAVSPSQGQNLPRTPSALNPNNQGTNNNLGSSASGSANGLAQNSLDRLTCPARTM